MVDYSIENLQEAIVNFVDVHTLVHESGKFTDLASEALGVAAEGVVLIASNMPDSDCDTCGLVRAAARGAYCLSEIGQAMLVSQSDAIEDPEKLETSIRRINADIVIAIIRSLLEHIAEETEDDDD